MIKKGSLLLFFWTLSIQSQSQEQVVWTTALEKVSDDIYLLKFEAKIKPKWHLYSQNLPANGPLPTEFIFKGEEGQFHLVGNTQEGKPKIAYDPIFEMELSWFDDEALIKAFHDICLKAEIKVIKMPEGLRRRATSKEMFWFNYGTKNVEVDGRSFTPQSVTRDII